MNLLSGIYDLWLPYIKTQSYITVILLPDLGLIHDHFVSDPQHFQDLQ